MRRTIAVLGILVTGGWALVASHPVWAFPALARQTQAACAACHTNPAGGPALTAAGTAFKADPKAALPSDAKAVDYVGSNKCKMCHLKQHTAWQKTDHAESWAALAGSDEKETAAMAESLHVTASHPATDAESCIGCHVTGFQLPGGYPAADSTKNVALRVVGCESCHGPGGKHVAAPMAEKKKTIAKSGEKLCQQCHTPAASPKFNFVEYKKKGVHAVAAPAKTSG